MKFDLHAERGEIAEKGEHLLEELAKALVSEAPELAEALHKALPPKEHKLKYPVLQDIYKTTAKAYNGLMQDMVKDISKVLDSAVARAVVKKSEEPLAPYAHLAKAGIAMGNESRQLMHTLLCKASELVSTEMAGVEISGGAPNIRTLLAGMQSFVSEQLGTDEAFTKSWEAQELTSGQLLGILESVVQSYGYQPKDLQKAAPKDHTQDLYSKDERAYERVKSVLYQRGYRPEDFEEGGKLYGYSVNELIELEREMRSKDADTGRSA